MARKPKPEDAADKAAATSPAETMQATSTGAADTVTGTDNPPAPAAAEVDASATSAVQSGDDPNTEGPEERLEGDKPEQAEGQATAEAAAQAEGAEVLSANQPGEDQDDAALDALAAVLDGPNPVTPKPASPGLGDPQILRITAKQPSRWRAGLNFTSEGRDIPLADLTGAQLELLANDPLLHVELR